MPPTTLPTAVARLTLKQIDLPGLIALDPSLRHAPLVRALSQTQLQALLPVGRLVPLARGQLVFRRGEPAHSLFLLLCGEVRLALEGEASFERVGKGAFFGECACLGSNPRRWYDATSVSCATAVEFPDRMLRAICRCSGAVSDLLGASESDRRQRAEQTAQATTGGRRG